MDISFNPILAFSWSVLAGFLMAMGAGGGGILAGIGHISILGIGDANTIKAINQLLELTSRFFSVPLYLKQKRLVWPLALSFGIGAPFGAIIGSWVSSNYLGNIDNYKSAFGILVLLVAGRTLYEALIKAKKRSHSLQKSFTTSNYIQNGQSETSNKSNHVPRITHLGILHTEVSIGPDIFSFNPLVCISGGFVISFVGATMGVGGGFLVTPFMVSILLFPMFFVVGTALVALMIPLTASILTYLYLNTTIDWTLVMIEIPGIAIGSIIGPFVNRRINERFLRLFVAAILFAIGLYYLI
jgi:hypothetical protein